MRRAIYDTSDCYLLPLIQRLWYVKADAGFTDIHGNAPDNLVRAIGIQIFDGIREVKAFMFPVIKLHIIIHIILSVSAYFNPTAGFLRSGSVLYIYKFYAIERMLLKTPCFYLIFPSLRKNDPVALSVALCNSELSGTKNILKPANLININ